MNDFMLATIVMDDTVTLVFDLLPGNVSCFGDAACSCASGYDLDTKMVNSNFGFLLRDFNFLKMFRNILFVSSNILSHGLDKKSRVWYHIY